GQEDRRERRVVKDDVSLVLVGKEAPKAAYRKEHSGRDEQAGVRPVPGGHERLRPEVDGEERAKLEQAGKGGDGLAHHSDRVVTYTTSVAGGKDVGWPHLTFDGTSGRRGAARRRRQGSTASSSTISGAARPGT